jgi:hypothetical protein
MNGNTPNSEWQDIKLSAKVFGHISQGLYRTPAGAIKELISNSFDADAEYVKIHTGFPAFNAFSCEDNGTGIAISQFQEMLDKGLGTSDKRSHEESKTPNGRPIIGRLGIGILSLAQICSQFRIISHHVESRTAFEVTIRFPAYTKEEVDKAEKQEDGYVIGGKYLFKAIPFEETSKGVSIYTSSLRDTFRKRMGDLGDRYARKNYMGADGPYSSFDEFMECIYKSDKAKKALSMSSDYDQLLFGLAHISPIPYYQSKNELGNIVLATSFLKKKQKQLQSYKFTVEVDNLRLARPIVLPSIREKITSKNCTLLPGEEKAFELEDGKYKEAITVTKIPIQVEGTTVQYAIYLVNYSNLQVGGRPLHFSGYVFNQTGRLYPREIQGVLIRIREVAIGGYDQSLMAYPLGEGPRFSMVSMEVFIEKGFEDALNIDRDSFNGLDPHYMRVQSYIHSMMKTVFPDIWSEEKDRNLDIRERKDKAKRKRFVIALSSTMGRMKVRSLSMNDRPATQDEVPVNFDNANETVELILHHPFIEPLLKRKKNRHIAQEICIAFERALMEKTEKRRRRVFYELLAEIVSS